MFRAAVLWPSPNPAVKIRICFMRSKKKKSGPVYVLGAEIVRI
jgi:hypothetical protein